MRRGLPGNGEAFLVEGVFQKLLEAGVVAALETVLRGVGHLFAGNVTLGAAVSIPEWMDGVEFAHVVCRAVGELQKPCVRQPAFRGEFRTQVAQGGKDLS